MTYHFSLMKVIKDILSFKMIPNLTVWVVPYLRHKMDHKILRKTNWNGPMHPVQEHLNTLVIDCLIQKLTLATLWYIRGCWWPNGLDVCLACRWWGLIPTLARFPIFSVEVFTERELIYVV